MRDVINSLLQAPDTQLDAAAKARIAGWPDPPKALEVLRVLDDCAHASLASSFVMRVLDTLYEQALEREGLTRAQAEANATWRTGAGG